MAIFPSSVSPCSYPFHLAPALLCIEALHLNPVPAFYRHSELLSCLKSPLKVEYEELSLVPQIGVARSCAKAGGRLLLHACVLQGTTFDSLSTGRAAFSHPCSSLGAPKEIIIHCRYVRPIRNWIQCSECLDVLTNQVTQVTQIS